MIGYFSNLVTKAYSTILENRVQEVITKSSNPQRYQEILNLLYETKDNEAVATIYTKLLKTRSKILFSIDDWTDLFNLYKKSNTSMPFKIDPSTLLIDDYSNLNYFLTSKIQSLSDYYNHYEKEWDFDEKAFLYLIQTLHSHGVMKLENEPEMVSIYNRKELVSLNYLLKEIKDRIEVAEYNHPWPRALLRMKNFLTNLSSADLEGKINRAINKDSVNFYDQIENKNKISDESLVATIDSILTKKDQLSAKAQSSLKKITSFLYALVEKIEELEPKDRVLVQNTIQKDLPELVINYISLPQSMREDLVSKEKEMSLQCILETSFDKIESDISVIHDKYQSEQVLSNKISQHRAVQDIKKVAKYLEHRSS